MTFYKQDEITQRAEHYINEQLEYEPAYIEKDLEERITDIHCDIFNNDDYLIYTQECIEWLGDHVLYCIEIIKNYEQENFDEVTCDFSMPHKVINMYVYIVGEQILPDLIDKMNSDSIEKMADDLGTDCIIKIAS